MITSRSHQKQICLDIHALCRLHKCMLLFTAKMAKFLLATHQLTQYLCYSNSCYYYYYSSYSYYSKYCHKSHETSTVGTVRVALFYAVLVITIIALVTVDPSCFINMSHENVVIGQLAIIVELEVSHTVSLSQLNFNHKYSHCPTYVFTATNFMF